MAKTSVVAVQRKRAGLNQHDFWSRVGVTQSGGSRYESGRPMPKPVRMLLAIAYGPGPLFIRTLRALRKGLKIGGKG